jgi:dTDP-4-dehydrorhamnose 3,5-epimerase
MTSSAKFTVTPTHIDGVLVIEPKILGDESGWFMESFNARVLSDAIGSDVKFVQDNQSFSKQWTLRGMHYQTEHAQGKLVRVVQACVFDVVVDVKKILQLMGSGLALSLAQKIISRCGFHLV